MRRFGIACAVVLVVCGLWLAGCASEPDVGGEVSTDSGIVGRWDTDMGEMLYEADGAYTYKDDDGTVLTEGVYSVEESGGVWVENATCMRSQGKDIPGGQVLPPAYFVISGDSIAWYESLDDAKAKAEPMDRGKRLD